MATWVLAGLGLGSAWMLGWSAAAAIPLIIHLLNRRRHRTVRWAAMHLLLRVLEKESRRVRMEQLLMLLLRMAILLVLALAVAQPVWRSEQADLLATSRPPVTWIVALDASYSMQRKTPRGVMAFAAARNAAEQLVEESPEGDAFAVIQIAEPSRGVVLQPTFDRTRTLVDLGRAQCLDTGGDLISGIALMQRIVEDVRNNPVLPQEVRIVIYSDMGEDTWAPVLSGAARNAWMELTDGAEVKVIAIEPDDAPNLAVTDLQVSTLRPLAGEPIEVSATVENLSAQAVHEFPVQVFADDNALASRFIDIEPHQSAVTRFQITPPAPGYLTIGAAIGDDGLLADNRRYASVTVAERQRVLVIESRPNSGKLIALALNPQSGGRSRWEVRMVTLVDLGTQDLSQWDVIVIDDGVTVTEPLRRRLKTFVAGGGSLICLFGPQCNPAAWNQGPEDLQLLHFELTEPSNTGDWRIDPLEYRSPVVAPFAGFPQAGLVTTPIFRYWKISPAAGRNLHIDVALESGDPLIVHHSVGEGVVMAWLSAPQAGTSRAGQPWNAIAAWPSFVPLMQQSVQMLLDVTAARLNRLVGETLEGTVKAAELQRVTIVAPDGTEHEIMLSRRPDGRATWTFDATDWHGIYRVQPDEGSVIPYAVNLRAEQSRSRSLPVTAIPGTSAAETEAADDRRDDSVSEYGLARWLLLTLVTLMACESLCAMAIGRRV